ncbi:MAG: hypothetical protein COS68_07510 [Elusimicrobia bacterium CG06_land_8_20_14_3_00_38_11]|nr:MAG: hypothetical protein COS68_07510 [Elusimicrobia bacterium CG06_land_8_20_14_3_00_38_11]
MYCNLLSAISFTDFIKSFLFCQCFSIRFVITLNLSLIICAIGSIPFNPPVSALFIPMTAYKIEPVFFHTSYYTFGELKIKEYFVYSVFNR